MNPIISKMQETAVDLTAVLNAESALYDADLTRIVSDLKNNIDKRSRDLAVSFLLAGRTSDEDMKAYLTNLESLRTEEHDRAEALMKECHERMAEAQQKAVVALKQAEMTALAELLGDDDCGDMD